LKLFVEKTGADLNEALEYMGVKVAFNGTTYSAPTVGLYGIKSKPEIKTKIKTKVLARNEKENKSKNEAYTVTNADKKGNTPAYQNYKKGMKSKTTGKPLYKAADHMKEEAAKRLGKTVQEMDDLNPSTEKTYLHHYNFPPYSVGETRPMRTPGRREIGHGALAERAIIPVLPGKETFPYVLRVVSEVLSSNGSTSMGSVCGSTLSLLDAGVPLKAPVSGTAMGLIKEGKEVRILTDIQGIEDFLGDMDFKVAGTEKGITALQMDMKITGLPVSVISDAIKKARPARLHILEKMQEAIEKPKESLSPHAPRLLSFRIDPELIGTVIGPGGRTIKGITERTNTKIDIEDGGIVTIASHDGAAAEEAQKIIEGLTRKVHEGEIFSGVVTRIIPIGAFVEILPGKEGMVHISQLSEARVERVEDVVRQGDEVTVRVREIDSRGRINLTLRGVGQNNGMSYPEPTPTPVAPLN